MVHPGIPLSRYLLSFHPLSIYLTLLAFFTTFVLSSFYTHQYTTSVILLFALVSFIMSFQPDPDSVETASSEMARATLPFTKPIRSIPSIQNCENFIPWKGTSSTSLHRITPRPSLPLLLCTTSSALPVVSHLTSSDVPQRSDEWFALRKDKLTTSSFSTALGFWSGNRRAELWHEKVFTPETPSFDLSAKAAMNWGVLNEAVAIEKYKSITGREVAFLGFATHADVGSGWLGASPDGVLGCYPDGGILEVKCPFNKGKPELALPWKAMPYYYMPQVQGQMEVMNREWVDLFCWTPNGSSIFRVNRDRGYWELIHRILHDFWFGHVVPARQSFLLGKVDHAKAFEPQPKHAQTNLVLFKSRKLAVEAKLLCKDIAGHVEFFK